DRCHGKAGPCHIKVELAKRAYQLRLQPDFFHRFPQCRGERVPIARLPASTWESYLARMICKSSAPACKQHLQSLRPCNQGYQDSSFPSISARTIEIRVEIMVAAGNGRQPARMK